MDIRIVEDGKNLHLLFVNINEDEKEQVASLLSDFSKKEVFIEKTKDIQSVSHSDIDLPPFFLSENTETIPTNDTKLLELGEHIVDMGKYQGKHLNIATIVENDLDWAKFVSTHSKQEDALKIKEFLSYKNL